MPVAVQSLGIAFGAEEVLADITLKCGAGEVVGIVGRSGVGKSTILNAIAGILHPSAGTVLIDGEHPDTAARQQRIGYVFQHPSLFPWRTAAENVRLPLLFDRTKTKVDANALVEQAMSFARIREAGDKFPFQLSGGMQTRVALARAIVCAPSTLLLDEPFSALDDLYREELYQAIQESLAVMQPAVILVTHNLFEAITLCDIIHVLKQDRSGGPSRFVGSFEILLGRPRLPEIIASDRFQKIWTELRGNLA
jgi:NitT/TauT family transport system ATP-binding protein